MADALARLENKALRASAVNAASMPADLGLITPPSAGLKRKIPHTPETAVDSPAASIASPSSGKIEASLASRRIEALQVPGPGHCDKKRVEILLYPEQQVKPYRYQFEKLANKAAVLDETIDMLAEDITKHGEITELVHPCLPRQEEITTVGRICCDAFEGKLNASSLMLEASRSIGNGNRVKLDVAAIHGFSLFPGQVLGSVGTNGTGDLFRAQRLLMPPPMPYERTTVSSLRQYHYDENKQNGKPMLIHIASGPYALDDSLEYEPLVDLLRLAEQDAPDVLILMGPFVDAEHPKIKMGDFACSLDDILREKVSSRIAVFRQKAPATQVIMVPSLLDAVHHYVFPQSPLVVPGLPKDVLCYPNPVTFSINEVTFGLSTNDILMHLSREEISRRAPNEPNVDRMARLAEHVVQQHNYYPLFPPAPGAQVDFGNSASLILPITPDILILPSDLKCFAKALSTPTVCVNPGRLTRKKAGGTYAKLVIYPLPRLEGGDNELLHEVTERTRVEIVRL